MKGVLDGVRVVELGQVLAGPFAGAIFADLGADVIKVEKPDGGDDARRVCRVDQPGVFRHRLQFGKQPNRLRQTLFREFGGWCRWCWIATGCGECLGH